MTTLDWSNYPFVASDGWGSGLEINIDLIKNIVKLDTLTGCGKYKEELEEIKTLRSLEGWLLDKYSELSGASDLVLYIEKHLQRERDLKNVENAQL